MTNAFLANATQHRLKLLCRVIYYSCTVSLVLFYIFVYYGHITGTQLKIRDKIKWSPITFHTKARNLTCLDNTFPTPDGFNLPCPNGTFCFTGLSECEPWLNCSHIALQVLPKQRIHGGMMKEKWLADWKGRQVVYMNCSRPNFKKQCFRGMTRIEKLQGPFVTRLIGRCYENLEIVTAYYKHGSAKTLSQILQRPQYSQYNNIQARFQLIVDYVKIMNFMHNSPIGTRVMCDTANLDKLLSQYLITDDFHMVVNDLDNTPDASQESGILCTNRKELRPFVAPEQRWPNRSVRFRLDRMPTYDEKVDIWKIPAVLERLLGEVNGSSFVKSKLRKVMERCHASNPQQRPTANDVLQELLRVQQLIEH
ncbi:hypothetical protein ACROYT_G012737 [Oculina patagonica]